MFNKRTEDARTRVVWVFAVGAGLSAVLGVVLAVLGASMESMLFAAGTAVAFLIGMATMRRVTDLAMADVDNAHQSE